MNDNQENGFQENEIKENGVQEKNSEQKGVQENEFKENGVQEKNSEQKGVQENGVQINDDQENGLQGNVIKENRVQEKNSEQKGVQENDVQRNNVQEHYLEGEDKQGTYIDENNQEFNEHDLIDLVEDFGESSMKKINLDVNNLEENDLEENDPVEYIQDENDFNEHDLEENETDVEDTDLEFDEQERSVDICDETEEGESEMNDETKMPYQCKLCNLGFSNINDITNHFSQTHENNDHKCDICNGSFSDKVQLDEHHKTMHVNAKIDFDSSDLESNGIEKNDYNDDDFLEKHVRGNDISNDIASIDFSEKGVPDTNNLEENAKDTNEMIDLKHEIQDDREKGRKSIDSDKLSNQLLERLTKKLRKIFKCVYCESEFSFKNNLKAHVKRNHEEKVENIDIEKISAVDKVQKSEKLQLHEQKSTDDKEKTRQVHKISILRKQDGNAKLIKSNPTQTMPIQATPNQATPIQDIPSTVSIGDYDKAQKQIIDKVSESAEKGKIKQVHTISILRKNPINATPSKANNIQATPSAPSLEENSFSKRANLKRKRIEMCGIVSKSKIKLRKRIKRDKNDKTSIENKMIKLSSYKCDLCKVSFSRLAKLKKHLELCGKKIMTLPTNTKVKPTKSATPKMVTLQKTSLTKAILTKTTSIPEKATPRKAKATKATPSKATLTKATPEKTTSKNVKTTKANNFDQSQLSYKCDLCEISFSSEQILKNHNVVAHHNADQLQKDTLQLSKRVTKDSKIKIPLVTQMSSGKLTDKNNPQKNRVIMVKGNKNMVREGKNKLQTQNDYRCDLCEETFSQKITLQKHLKLCLKKQFSSFSKASLLESRLKDKTNQPDIKKIKLRNRKLYQCRMCNLSFSRKIRLEKHIASIHKNDQNKEIAEDHHNII